MTLQEKVSLLSSVQLNNTPECRGYLHRLINSFFPLYWLHHPLKNGVIISRCRRDAPNLKRDSFGYKSPESVYDYQRASIPHESVFYGAVGDRGPEDGDLIAMLETSKLHREGKPIGKEEIYVSRWIVTHDIDMAIICHPKVFSDTTPQAAVKDMQENYQRRLPYYPNQDLIPDFDGLVEFVSSQFAKKVKDGDNHQYMISAYFAHNTLETDAGIIYPSVQVNGRLGYNVALRPDIVDSHLDFIGAEKHILYKAKEYMQVPINTYSDEHLATSLGIGSLDFLPKI